ncbi:MAG: hypothetical protein HY720_14280 [Planctomycetes bacterium]|nr:hypothetical protein [Planctomycetota bacterium]
MRPACLAGDALLAFGLAGDALLPFGLAGRAGTSSTSLFVRVARAMSTTAVLSVVLAEACLIALHRWASGRFPLLPPLRLPLRPKRSGPT